MIGLGSVAAANANANVNASSAAAAVVATELTAAGTRGRVWGRDKSFVMIDCILNKSSRVL